MRRDGQSAFAILRIAEAPYPFLFVAVPDGKPLRTFPETALILELIGQSDAAAGVSRGRALGGRGGGSRVDDGFGRQVLGNVDAHLNLGLSARALPAANINIVRNIFPGFDGGAAAG